MKQILLPLFAASLMLTLAFRTHQPNVPRTGNDTVKPKFQYFYKLMIPVNKFNSPLDTIDMVMQRMGKSMTVDQADEMRAIVGRQLTNFIGRPVLDSVKIVK
jgi:hypothetical protein